MALSAIARVKECEGVTTIIDVLRGSRRMEITAKGYDKLKTYGVGRQLSFAAWNAYLLQMLQLGLFDIAYNEGNHLKITDYGWDILRGRRTVQLSKFYYDNQYGKASPTKEKEKESSGTLPLNVELDKKLIDILKGVRYAIAKKQGVPPYIIFNDKVLEIIAAEKPTTKEQFSSLYGIGEKKTEMYWKQITSAIKDYIQQGK